MDDFCVASTRGKHEGSLVILVEGGAWAFVPCFEEHLADLLVAERGGKVHVGVGEANRRGVGVVEERRVGFEDALHEQGIAGVDCASQSNRRLDPVGIRIMISIVSDGRHSEERHFAANLT